MTRGARTGRSGTPFLAEAGRCRSRSRRAASPGRILLVFVLEIAGFGAAHAQTSTSDPLEGRVFEFGLGAGAAFFSEDSGLDSCAWTGARFAHRFEPFRAAPSLQLGFRVGIEGCRTDHVRGGRIDIIHGAAAILLGIRASRSTLIYWSTGVGELLGDSTPGPGDDVEPRFAWHGGPGVKWAISRRFLLDATLMGIVYEGFELGAEPGGTGSTLAVIPNLALVIQI